MPSPTKIEVGKPNYFLRKAQFDNVLVLRAGQSRFVACPRSGKKSAANFDVIDVVAREPVTTLSKTEVYAWLWRASQNEDDVARGTQP